MLQSPKRKHAGNHHASKKSNARIQPMCPFQENEENVQPFQHFDETNATNTSIVGPIKSAAVDMSTLNIHFSPIAQLQQQHNVVPEIKSSFLALRPKATVDNFDYQSSDCEISSKEDSDDEYKTCDSGLSSKATDRRQGSHIQFTPVVFAHATAKSPSFFRFDSDAAPFAEFSSLQLQNDQYGIAKRSKPSAASGVLSSSSVHKYREQFIAENITGKLNQNGFHAEQGISSDDIPNDQCDSNMDGQCLGRQMYGSRSPRSPVRPHGHVSFAAALRVVSDREDPCDSDGDVDLEGFEERGQQGQVPSTQIKSGFFGLGGYGFGGDGTHAHSSSRLRSSSEMSPPVTGDFGTPLTEVGSDASPRDLDGNDSGVYDYLGMDHDRTGSPVLSDSCRPRSGMGSLCGANGVFGRLSKRGGQVDPHASPDESFAADSNSSFDCSDVSDISVSSAFERSGLLGTPSRRKSAGDIHAKLDTRATSSPLGARKYHNRSLSDDAVMSTVGGLFSSSFASNISSSSASSVGSSGRMAHKPRPLPDQSAFDRSISGGGGISKPSPMASPVCPATPMRTPQWALDDSASARANTSGIMAPPALTRQNSLVMNKVLAQSNDGIESKDVSFHRDFDNVGTLGAGTCADVFKVKERGSGSNGKYFAVKKAKQRFRSRKDREWLLNEVRVMKRIGQLPCKYIINLVKAWQEEGFFYVQIDLAERGTVKELMMELAQEGRCVPDSVVWQILHNVSAGLEHMHSFQIVHMDIKPANLLISEDGIVKIGDFGIATDQGSVDDAHDGDSKYLAPEVLETNCCMPAADIFSCGITLYEICLAHTASARNSSHHDASNVSAEFFQLPQEGEPWHALRQGRADPLLDRPLTLQQLIAAAMAPDPQRRPSAAQLLVVNEVVQAGAIVDPVLQSAMPPQVVAPNRAARSISFDPNHHAHFGVIQFPYPVDDSSEPMRVNTPTGELGFFHSMPNRNHPFIATALGISVQASTPDSGVPENFRFSEHAHPGTALERLHNSDSVNTSSSGLSAFDGVEVGGSFQPPKHKQFAFGSAFCVSKASPGPSPFVFGDRDIEAFDTSEFPSAGSASADHSAATTAECLESDGSHASFHLLSLSGCANEEPESESPPVSAGSGPHSPDRFPIHSMDLQHFSKWGLQARRAQGSTIARGDQNTPRNSASDPMGRAIDALIDSHATDSPIFRDD